MRSRALSSLSQVLFCFIVFAPEVYLSKNRRHDPGICLSAKRYAGSDKRIIKGVRKVVITDTATTIGYRKWSVTLSDRPNDAMMNANSPICASEKPDCMATFNGCPDSRMPKDENSICPTITTSVIKRMGNLYSHNKAGSINIPTETKKMAPKRFLTGFVRCSMCSASRVSARMDPITKAPRADEKPDLVANITIPRHSPILTMSSVSSFRYFFVFRRNDGSR